MENFSNKNIDRQGRRKMRSTNDNRWTGLFLLIFGAALLLRNMDLDLPRWIFRWEVILIGIGLFVGAKQQFRGAGWFIMVTIGGVSLLDQIFPIFFKPQFTWAVIAIIIGAYFLLRPRAQRYDSGFTSNDNYPAIQDDPDVYSGQEVLDSTAVFGHVKKVIVSKNFRGGEIVAVMGGAEIDFSQADIKGRVRLEATNIMGGTKLIIPPTWDVQSEMVAVFGGVDDKRDVHSLNIDPTKVLILEGTCLFGGLEIKNY